MTNDLVKFYINMFSKNSNRANKDWISKKDSTGNQTDFGF